MTCPFDFRRFAFVSAALAAIALPGGDARAQTSTAGGQPTKPPIMGQTSAATAAGVAPETSKMPAPPCNCLSSKDDGHWTGKDWATLLTGFGGLLGVFVAALAIWSNGRSSRATTIQKANEKELESLQSKLDDFYGPYLQLSKTNQLIADDFKSRHSSPKHMRILLLLLDPTWRHSLKSGDQAFIEEILAIDGKLLDLIQDKSGLTSNVIQEYLWRAASHFRIIKMAFDGKLENDPQRFIHHAYPKQLDEIIDLEIKRIQGRIDLIRSAPMELRLPTPDLVIPPRLKLPAWPSPDL